MDVNAGNKGGLNELLTAMLHNENEKQSVKFHSRIDAGQKIAEEPQPEADQSSDESNDNWKGLRPVPASRSQQATSHDGLFEG